LGLDDPINETLSADTHVWVVLKGDLDEQKEKEPPKSYKVLPLSAKARPQTAGFFRKLNLTEVFIKNFYVW